MWKPALAAIALLLLTAADPDRPAPALKPLAFSILEDYDKGDDLADVARDFALMRDIGVRTWRGSFGWDDFEPERGRYDFDWLHRFVALAAARGITLRPYIGYTPAWAAAGTGQDGQAWNQPPADQRAWRAFVSALARELRHHPNVPSLEIYNEENVAQWWDGSRDDYTRTLIAASRAARAPGRAVIGDAPNYHLGITRVDRSPKLAYRTVRRLVELVGSGGVLIAGNAAAVQPIVEAGELHHRTFVRADGTRLSFVWNRTADQRVRVTLRGAGTIAEYGLDGSLQPDAPVSPFETTLERGVPRVYRWAAAGER